ncbi:MAG: ABC transporter permease, partial [Chloroflexi bacterium]|nr:ABC transporter permease [Chloroflexota bacterium]
ERDRKRKLVNFSQKQLQGIGLALMPFALAVGVFLWYLLVRVADIRPHLLPPPDLVWAKFTQTLMDGRLFRHSMVTLSEVLAGLGIGALVASTLGYLLAKSRPMEQILSPYIVASQSVPTVAIAPLLVIWFGPGLTSKVLICALIVFFPILINTIVGIRSVPEDLRDLMRSLQATRWQTFTLMEFPAALPVLLGGLRIGATLSVIGAVVGEFVGGDRGLGFLINEARFRYDTALVFVAVFTLVAMALVLYGLVVFLETRFLSWQRAADNLT